MRVTRIFENLHQSDTIAALDQETFVELVAKHKALLLRSDDVGGSDDHPFTVDDFAEFVENLNLERYEYVGGAAPRRLIPVKSSIEVYTANEAPPDQLIPFHHELAQVKDPPQYIFFYCDVPAESGGETALIDSTLVYRFVSENHPEFMTKLKKYGARYKRILPPQDDPSSPIGRSYYNAYQVSNKIDLEKKLNGIDGLEYEWISSEDGANGANDGSLLKVITEPIPAVRMIEQQHQQNGTYHGIYQWTFHNSIIAAFLGWEDSRNDRKTSVRFGNDESMDESVLESIAKFMEENKFSYQWRKGDVFALNNRLVMHARNSYTGMRRVYASMFGGALSPSSSSPPIMGSSEEGVVKRDCIGQIMKEYSSLQVSDPTTFGMWRLTNPTQTVYDAIKAGYRRFDSACDYGNEEQTGRGIRRAIEEGLVKREELYITTKLWNTYHSPEHVPMALERSLKDLGLDYVDEFLIHFPISMEFVPFEQKYPPEWTNLSGKMILIPNDINSTWRAMEKLVDSGKTKFIGLSNFNCQHIRQILSIARIRPTTLQIECHPHLSQSKLIRFARESGIRVSAFSPLGGTSYVSLDMASEEDLLFDNPIIVSIAKKYRKTAAQVKLRWAIQRNTLPISKSSSLERMVENRGVFDFYLTREEMGEIDGLNKNRRYNDPGVFCEEGMGTFCPIYE